MADVPCNFSFHEFTARVCDQSISCHIIRTDSCFYLWLGNPQEEIMADLALGIQSPLQREPLTTKILGPIANEDSCSLAKRLAKKLQKPVYVSFNFPADNLSLPIIERALKAELQAHPELL